VHHDGSVATATLGVPGFVLLAVSEVEGKFGQAVETTAAEAAGVRSAVRPNCTPSKCFHSGLFTPRSPPTHDSRHERMINMPARVMTVPWTRSSAWFGLLTAD
jgi:hypothetical protein